MTACKYDIIVIGCGSAGLSVGLFMGMAGFKVLMVSKSDHDIGGDCLNEGCVPSKALIHVAKLAHQARQAAHFGLALSGNIDISKALDYVYQRQENIREHENAAWLIKQGVGVVLGEASFIGRNEITVVGKEYWGRKIVIATGSRPKKLSVPGVDKVVYYDNENIFKVKSLPHELMVIGGGPAGLEIAQVFNRLGSKVTVIYNRDTILPQDDPSLTEILLRQLKNEGIIFYGNASVEHFISGNEATVRLQDHGLITVSFEAVFAGIGRELDLEPMQLHKAGVVVRDGQIVANELLQTTNRNIFVCGDVSGGNQFSHAAEANARLLLHNFFSPWKKRLNNDYMSRVTFTDPEVAAFGLSEIELKARSLPYEKLVQDFKDDDRAVIDNYQYARAILYISKRRFLRKQQILGGTIIAPGAGELIQELILATSSRLSLNAIFNKIYPYPTAARVNQQIIVQYKSKSLTCFVKTALRQLYKIFS